MYHVRMNRAEGVDMEEFHPGTIPQEGTCIAIHYSIHIAYSYVVYTASSICVHVHSIPFRYDSHTRSTYKSRGPQQAEILLEIRDPKFSRGPTPSKLRTRFQITVISDF